MTKAAKHFKKKLSNFWDSPQTGEYLEAMLKFPEFQAIKIAPSKRGRHGGTWCHPKQAVIAACCKPYRTKSSNGDIFEFPIVFREDGYINMTKAASHFPGKNLRHFWDNKDTRLYMASLAEISGIPDIKISKCGISTDLTADSYAS